MDGYLQQTLLEDPQAFHPYRGIHGIDLWRSADPPKRIFQHSEIAKEHFSDWLRQDGQYRASFADGEEPPSERLRLLICTSNEGLRDWGRTGGPGTGAPALPMSSAQYEDAIHCMGLPKDLLTLLYRQTAAWTTGADGGFVLKNNSSRTWHFGLASSDPTIPGSASSSTNHAASWKSTNMLLVGLEEPQINELIQTLEHEDGRLPLQALLPIVLIELRAQAALRHIDHSHTAIFYMEGQTGVFTEAIHRMPARENGYRLTRAGVKVMPGVRKSVDYEAVTVELTSTITELSHALFTCDVNIRMLEALPGLMGMTTAPCSAAEQNNPAYRHMINKIDYLKSYYQGLESRANYVMRRAQAQVQTVYSMVAQRDSAASTALAEASRQDNILMRKIAEDSKRVAVATSRDSASMKIIAAVTILFLPATFVATLFSTSFFNFQQPGRVVSWWVWLYWLVTVMLTVTIHAAWYFISRQKEREIEQNFGDSAQEIRELTEQTK